MGETPQGAGRDGDRRARYTRAVIRAAFFELLAERGFSGMSVTDLCKRAQINRGTFYLHYEDKYALADELVGEALEAGNHSPDQAPLSVCQRVPECEEYARLYRDPEIGSRIVERIVRENVGEQTARMAAQTGLPPREVAALFTFTAYGNFAVNRMLGWKKDAEWIDLQRCIKRFVDGGLRALAEGERHV